jgi:hypothetical protein
VQPGRLERNDKPSLPRAGDLDDLCAPRRGLLERLAKKLARGPCKSGKSALKQVLMAGVAGGYGARARSGKKRSKRYSTPPTTLHTDDRPKKIREKSTAVSAPALMLPPLCVATVRP